MAESATFRVRRVKCRDEMGGKYREKFGNDEIKAAVFSADLRGSTKNSGRFEIYPDFDDGDVKTFDPPMEVVTLDLAGKTGEVEVAFSVLLIESQLTEGDSLEKAWNEFVKIYGEALQEEVKKRELTVEQAYAVAQPGYLAPERVSDVRGRVPWDVIGGVGTLGTVSADSTETSSTRSATAVLADDTDLMDPNEGDTAEEDKGWLEKTGDAFVAAVITACALYAVKYAGAAVSALIGWAQDKFFPPVAIKATIDASSPSGTVPPNATGVAEFRGHDGIYELEWDILVR